MRNLRSAVILLLLSGCLAAVANKEISAQQQFSSTNPLQTIKRTPLRKVDVPGGNYEVVFAMVEIPPNTKVGRHSHPGTVFAYLLEGDYKLLIDGQPAKEYKAGETFEIAPEPIYDEQVGEKPAKALVVFTVEKENSSHRQQNSRAVRLPKPYDGPIFGFRSDDWRPRSRPQATAAPTAANGMVRPRSCPTSD